MICQVLQSALRQSGDLPTIGSKLGQHGEVVVELGHEILFRFPLIAVDAYERDTVITRIALQILGLVEIGSHAWRIGPEQVVEATAVEIVL